VNIALCTCGVDVTRHAVEDGDEKLSGLVQHLFIAAGTRHACLEEVPGSDGLLCPRPRYHEEHEVEHGPLTGRHLWTDDLSGRDLEDLGESLDQMRRGEGTVRIQKESDDAEA
jgi:hypothetical protein